jgi:hypothetical protein
MTAFDYGDQMEDLAWPHLLLVDKASLQLFSSKIAIAVESSSFLSVLVSNSCSPDYRERQSCRDVLAAVYRKCELWRPQIVRFICNQFLTLTCSREVLEFHLIVVDGMPQPLAPESIAAFTDCVLILHSSDLFQRFCLSLVQVLNYHIRVDAGLLNPTFESICCHPPSSIVRKQLIFLSEMITSPQATRRSSRLRSGT